MARKNNPNARHIVPSPNGGWDVKKPGAKRASAHAQTQDQAIKRASTILQNDGGGELRIHGKNGRMREANTIPPGNDPYPPKG